MIETLDTHIISSGKISAAIRKKGAELCSLKTATGAELIWQAGAAWPRHAPHLFPIVGKLKNDEFRHKGRIYKMSQHGFARDSDFTWLEKKEDSCRLILRDSDQTRAIYPFSFEFEICFTIADETLTTRYTIRNLGEEVMPASIGAHPAFNWPLQPGVPKDSYALIFSHQQHDSVSRLANGLLSAQTRPSHMNGRTLHLSEKIFEDDAIILSKVSGNSVLYGSQENERGIKVTWDENFTSLGIWSKPGGDFLCIEPWRGTASPENFEGEIWQKPGIKLIPPGAVMASTFSIHVIP